VSTESRKPRHLPAGLTATVSEVEALLGQVVADTEGQEIFDTVEGVRRAMVAFREDSDPDARERALDEAAGRLASLDTAGKTALARAYTLYLQLVNVCENAYRTHRLRRGREPEPEGRPGAELTLVLTAHPTESRSPENIRLLRRVQDALIAALERGESVDRAEIQNLIRLAWRVGTHPARKPSVDDEANHLFSLLDDPILTEFLSLAEAGHRVLLRSWVGGDKDGHPGVGPDQTVAALQRSRSRLLSFVDAALVAPVRADADLVALPEIDAALVDLRAALGALETVAGGDGARVTALRATIEAFQSTYREAFAAPHPSVGRVSTLLDIFPALVVPLELREERGHFGADAPIADMMRRIADIADGGAVDAYARAVVVSMTLAAVDLLEAQRCVEGAFGGSVIPVIPLFELPDTLERATGILDETWRDESFRRAVSERGHFEVMLGYSDTAKRMGMLASRVALHDAMRDLGAWGEAHQVRVTFFHGHGGSVGRGGGRIEDVMATWPPRARRPYKYTVQGEMVERTLATHTARSAPWPATSPGPRRTCSRRP
jgi:phosphoenolpyruvate carboxylase